MRKECKLEILSTPKSRCFGAHSVDCGVTMVNYRDFSDTYTSTYFPSANRLLPGKLIIDTAFSVFYKEQFKISCYTSTQPTVNIITISNICDEAITPYHINDLGNPLGLADI